MGDRANVVMTDSDEKVVLYTHWSGYELPEIVKKAMIRGKNRWDDFQYFTRIVFSEMIQNSVLSETGFGISSTVHDGNDKIIKIDCNNQTIKVYDKPKVTFEDFVK